MAQWTKLLKTLGFTDSESKIYLISLEMGPSSVQDIAKKTEVSRVTTYAVIESLTKHGLMSSVQKGKKTYYTAETPERLVSYVQNRIKNMDATLKEVEHAINDLKLMQGGERPVVKMFEGHEALKAIYDDVFRSKPEQMDEFGNRDELNVLYADADLNASKEKLRTFIPKMRGFYLSSQEPKNTNRNASIAWLPKNRFNFDGDVIVYGNKVALSTFKGKQISVLIESRPLADTMRAMFDAIKL